MFQDGCEVRGPGMRGSAPYTRSFARGRANMKGLEIRHNVGMHRIELTLPASKHRPTVWVPWGKVDSCEPLNEVAEAERRMEKKP